MDHNTYDHTSVLAIVEDLFKLGSLTKRDGTAQNLSHLLKPGTPRIDAPLALPDPAVSGYVHKVETGNSVSFRLSELMMGLISLLNPKAVDPSLRGFHHVALLRDLQDSPETQKEETVRRFLGHKAFGATRYMKRVRQKTTAQKANA